MPIGIVSDEDLLKELENVSQPIRQNRVPSEEIKQGEIVEANKPGRNEGDRNVPSALRALISETSQIDGRKSALEFANQFGISPSSVSAYNKEVNSTNQYNQTSKPEIKNHVDKIRKNISKKARGVLRNALENITDEKLSDSKAVELASIAKSMSSIVNEMEPPQAAQEDKSVPQIVIYAPTMRTEQSFEFIQVNE